MLALAITAALAANLKARPSDHIAIPQAPARAFSTAGLLSLPSPDESPISARLGGGAAAYRITPSREDLTASNPLQNERIGFSRAGVQVRSGRTDVRLELRAAGYGATLTPLARVAPKAQANRVVYTRGSLDETYRNGPLGLEQSFTIKRPLRRAASGPLILSISIHSNARLSSAADGRGIEIGPVTGKPRLRYTEPVATDARGRSLHSWLVLETNRLLLRVDARGARYPLHVDPFVQQGPPLAPSTTGGFKYFGFSVALSSNGSTALVGAPHGVESGLAFVFTRSGETWTQQAQLRPTNDEEQFGHGVALSGDGNTALVGGDKGWVFTRSGETWTQQGAPLVGNDAVGGGNNFFEGEVALSADGNTALFGHAGDNGNVGAVWVFTRSGALWTQEGSKLIGGGETGAAEFGASLALSGEGSTALIGGDNDARLKGHHLKGGYGAAWVFTRSGETWTQQGPKLTSATEGKNGRFGKAVALSSNGSTALIDGGNRNHPPAVVFTRSGETWTQGPELIGATAKKDPTFGDSVSLSGDGNTALIGDWNDSKNVGAAWIFTRSGEAWTRESAKLTGSGESGKALFGWSAALASEGTTALIGENAFNGGQAWVFTR